MTHKQQGYLEVAEALRSIVKTVGSDYRYQYVEVDDGFRGPVRITECVYSTPEGEPSCIVGHLLYNEAPKIFELLHNYEWWKPEEYDRIWPNTLSVGRIDRALRTEYTEKEYPKGEWLGERFDLSAQHLLIAVQRFQDSSETWERSVEIAVEIVGGMECDI